MAVVKDRPLSEAQEFALSALSQHGFIVRVTGSFFQAPSGCQVAQRTIDSLAKRGYGKPGIVKQGDLELTGLLRQDVQSPVIVGAGSTPAKPDDPIVRLRQSDVAKLMVYMVGHCEYREEAGREEGISAREMDVLRRVSKAAGVPIPPYEPGGCI